MGASFPEVLQLLEFSLLLARAHDIPAIAHQACLAAKRLLGADGVTFVMREGEHVFYAEEESPERLWRGRRFLASECISGWAILHRQTAVIEDVFSDSRIPVEAYRPTFVKSLAMVPVGGERPTGAMGVYWARTHRATERELFLLEFLAEAVAAALERAGLLQEVALLRATSSGVERAPRGEEGSSLHRLIPILAHDLKNPLSAISLASQSLLKRGSLSASDQLNVRRILSSVERARHLVDDVLEYARLRERGGLPLEVSATRLDELVRAVVDEAQAAFPDRWIELIADPVLGRWDAHRLAEVVANLLGNALQYGHPKRPATVRVEAQAGESLFEVHNFGPAIPAELLPVLFEPFRRGRDEGRNSVGLGLFIARQIVQAHGGRIEVFSTPEAGTAFTVHLPVHQVEPIRAMRHAAV